MNLLEYIFFQHAFTCWLIDIAFYGVIGLILILIHLYTMQIIRKMHEEDE